MQCAHRRESRLFPPPAVPPPSVPCGEEPSPALFSPDGDQGDGGGDEPPPLIDDDIPPDVCHHGAVPPNLFVDDFAGLGVGGDGERLPLVDDPVIHHQPPPPGDDGIMLPPPADHVGAANTAYDAQLMPFIPGAAPVFTHDNDGMERGSLRAADTPRTLLSTSLLSVSARVKAFYERFPETIQAVPCVNPAAAGVATAFDTPVMKSVLRFSVTAGRTGLVEADQLALARVLLGIEAAMTVPGGPVGQMSSRLDTPSSLVAALRAEQSRVLAERKWQQVPIEVLGKEFFMFFRDPLHACIDAMQTAESVVLEGAALEPTPDDERRRSGTLDADMYLEEQAEVRRLYGRDAFVMGWHVHSDEAVISWSGTQQMYAVRVLFVNILDGGGTWETVAYLPHIPKVVGNGRNARSRRAVADARSELVQRCYAVIFRRAFSASEHGVRVDLPGRGRVLLVPRVLALVVDQVEERSILGLMGSQCAYNCTHCMAQRNLSCVQAADAARPRPVISTLEAQLEAAQARLDDGRPRTRVALGRAMSALPFVPALGAMHGLGTGRASLYRIVSFGTLHVWKLGVWRLLTQRLPAMLEAACDGDGAVMGSVQDTLDAINLRGFELGRLCRASPSTPGYVRLTVLPCWVYARGRGRRRDGPLTSVRISFGQPRGLFLLFHFFLCPDASSQPVSCSRR